jgi:hypothetical protein
VSVRGTRRRVSTFATLPPRRRPHRPATARPRRGQAASPAAVMAWQNTARE